MSLSKYIEQKAQAFEDQQEHDKRLASELIDCAHCGTPRDPTDTSPCCASTEEMEAEKELEQLRAELAASENLVTALQAELAATAQRAAESVREAREEQREACVRAADRWFASVPPPNQSPVESIRATPLEATPLRERIEWLERERDEYFARHGSSADCDRERDALKAQVRDLLDAWGAEDDGAVRTCLDVLELATKEKP